MGDYPPNYPPVEGSHQTMLAVSSMARAPTLLLQRCLYITLAGTFRNKPTIMHIPLKRVYPNPWLSSGWLLRLQLVGFLWS